MTYYLVSKDAGDMGTAEGNTKIEQIPLLVIRIADVFSKLSFLKPNDKMFSYCIQFRPEYKYTVECMLRDIEKEGLPQGITFYEVGRNRIFENRGPSGGVTFSMSFYLICK